ncbi:hypothetical protein FACS1894193_09040 [Bacilli bacterium]|nr:hypothetical protein FACS1894193_09040 [Bacilli bacterium]
MLIGLGMSLAAVLLSRTADADVNTPGNAASATGTTNVTYTVPSTYTVVIPGTLAITTANTPVGDTNNVFIKTNSQVLDTEAITVSLAPQTFAATKTGSSMPFTVAYTTRDGATTTAGATVTTLASSTVILKQTGAQIAAVTDMTEDVTGAAGLSVTVKAQATAAQIAQASSAGQHTGTIQFSVAKG